MNEHKRRSRHGGTMDAALARQIADVAAALARHYRGAVTVVVVDAGAHPVLLQRMDGATLGSIQAALGKARSAVLFARPTSALERGGWSLGTVSELCAVAGGMPVVHKARIIGGVGISGLTPQQDEEVAKACCAIDALADGLSAAGSSTAPGR